MMPNKTIHSSNTNLENLNYLIKNNILPNSTIIAKGPTMMI